METDSSKPGEGLNYLFVVTYNVVTDNQKEHPMPSVTSNVQVIRSAERYHADHGWLDTRWHFSFADYNDPDNVHFGPLRVFNDDVVRVGGGFDMHPHRDMEIITYVISGQLEHRDHLGNRGVVHPGEVQVMSAG
jgi:redox-sensitive bicupin YhaK (pirin superfamily)